MTPARRVAVWLHRRGYARMLSSQTNNMNRCAGAYIETRGPRWLGERLWRYALRHDTLTSPDWLSVRVTDVQQVSHGTFRWDVKFDRIAART